MVHPIEKMGKPARAPRKNSRLVHVSELADEKDCIEYFKVMELKKKINK